MEKQHTHQIEMVKLDESKEGKECRLVTKKGHRLWGSMSVYQESIIIYENQQFPCKAL